MVVDDSLRTRLREARQTRVRYGRAFLTVARFGGLSGDELERCLTAYEDGNADAEAVCWAFVRKRVIDHTPSFSWENVELPLLLDRTVAVSTIPEFSSSEIEDVAEILVDEARKEREALERARKQSLRLMDQVASQFNLHTRMQETLSGFTGWQKFGVPGFLENSRPLHFAAVDAAKRISLGDQMHERLTETLGVANQTIATSPAMIGFRKQIMASDISSFTGIGSMGFDVKNLGIGLAKALNLDQWNYELPALQGFGKQLGALYQPQWLEQLGGKGSFIQSITDASRRWIEAFKRALPINWRDLDGSEVDAVVKLMLDTGISLAWAPRTSIIRELLAAETSREHKEILEARSAEILEDIEEALEEITSTRLLSSVEACKESVATCRDGHPDPALAYASTILSHLVHDYFEEKSFKGIREAIEDVDPLNDVGHTDFPLFTVGRIWVRAFERFENSEDDAYNRNRTLHILGDHYCEANLLAALMLVTGLLCELQRFEGRRAVDDEVNDVARVSAAA
jgi:hypothetical protein